MGTQIKLFVSSTLQFVIPTQFQPWSACCVHFSCDVVVVPRRRRAFLQLQEFYHAKGGKRQASKLISSKHDRHPSKVGPSTFVLFMGSCTTFWEIKFSTGQATWFKMPFRWPRKNKRIRYSFDEFLSLLFFFIFIAFVRRIVLEG